MCEKSEVIAEIQSSIENRKSEIVSPFSGILRGLLHPGLTVTRGMKIGDIDPRDDPRLCRWSRIKPCPSVAGCWRQSSRGRKSALNFGPDQQIQINKNILRSGVHISLVENPVRLSQALRLSNSARLALVGSGGKTTALFQLARELSSGGGPVIVTATTHLHVDQVKLADSHLDRGKAGRSSRSRREIDTG